jgi:release factor glutamine methyltransferase
MTVQQRETVGGTLRRAAQCLAPGATARLDAELLLCHVLECSRAALVARDDVELSPDVSRRYWDLIQQRSRGVPVAYLRGHVAWWNLDLEVSPNVLVPRPDTETLVERALAMIDRSDLRFVVDVGTGSGAIALALATARSDLAVLATDISSEALAMARRNVDLLGVEDRVQLLHGSLLDPVPTKPELVTANLPYLSDAMMAELPLDVRHEPQLALRGGGDGLDLYRELFCQLNDRGWKAPLLCEIDPRQSTEITVLVTRMLPGSTTRVWRDLAGRDRVVEVTRP